MIQKNEKFLNEKNVQKLTKRAHAFEGFASSYKFNTLNSFNPELQLKDTESAIKKTKKILTEFSRFTFVATLILLFKKRESDDKKSMTLFNQTQKQKYLSMKAILMMYLNQYILKLYQTHKSLYEKAQAGLLIQSLTITLVFQNIIP